MQGNKSILETQPMPIYYKLTDTFTPYFLNIDPTFRIGELTFQDVLSLI